MRAVVYTETGDSSVLEVVEREAADPGPGEVRVRIVRAGVNPTDWKFRAGGMGELAFPEVVPGPDVPLPHQRAAVLKAQEQAAG